MKHTNHDDLLIDQRFSVKKKGYNDKNTLIPVNMDINVLPEIKRQPHII